MTESEKPVTKSSPELNFLLPVKSRMESDRIVLVPYETSKYAAAVWEQLSTHPELHRWFQHELWTSFEDCRDFFDAEAVQDRKFAMWVVLDKPTLATRDTSEMQLAGLVGLSSDNLSSARIEIGAVFVFPKFQRTHVASHMVGLLLEECLTPAPEDGLGMRRVAWRTNSKNTASRRLAERMGFTFEGVQRWAVVLPETKEGNGVDVTLHRDRLKGVKGYEDLYSDMGPGRDTAWYSLCWDDWFLDGKKEHVRRVMARTS